MIIPKDKCKCRRKEKLKEKHCQFPLSDDEVCNKLFYGTGRSKFCMTHRDRKFRSIIDKHKKKKKISVPIEETGNQIINHKFETTYTFECNCALEGCNEKFRFTVIPKQVIYPKYCEHHRNIHKRKQFEKMNVSATKIN